MNSIKDVSQHIQKLVNDNINSGQVVSVDWLISEILGDFHDIQGTDVDFYLICARHYIVDQAKRLINKFAPKVTQDKQLTMEGFRYLQGAYALERGGSQVIVPTQQMTDAEIDDRAAEYEAMSNGCLGHREELLQYKASRDGLG
jgi:hypothetical protein